MPNLFWIAYYKSLVLRDLMSHEEAMQHIRRLREFEKNRHYRFNKSRTIVFGDSATCN
ncbi:MAG: hypothetical protein OEX83_03255 [Gammaproteobacteria bacterium]|nr:hypothetical protein [Gammaproteobacteria bacterium]